MGNDQPEKPKTLDGGKGSAPRPIDWARFEENWDKIFGTKKDDREPDTKSRE